MPNYLKNTIAALVLALCAGAFFYLDGYYPEVRFNTDQKSDFDVKVDFLPAKDQTGSPFFQVMGADTEESLALQRTDVQVSIAGVIADVEVTQFYQNRGTDKLEAIYVFPASTNAAVYAMEMTVGGRTTYAKVSEKQEARAAYKAAKKEGKSVSLLEQQRPNVFQMNVANIEPNNQIKVTLHYTELLIPTNGTYEFVYPTVVAPRYEGMKKEGGWTSNPYANPEQSTANRKGVFSIQTTILGGMPVQRIQSSSHPIKVNYTDAYTAVVALADRNIPSQKDYILQYQLKGKAIESGILLYEGEKENFFLAMIQPPRAMKKTNIPAREYVFVLDVSGSMVGKPLEITKELMQNLLSELRPEDRFNVMLFEYGNQLLFPASLPATSDNVDKALSAITTKRGSGGTELIHALERVLALKATKKMARSFIIVTDGHVNVEKEAFELVQHHLGEANFFAFGIGESINRYLIEGLAYAGKTTPMMITKMDEAEEKVNQFQQYINSPVMTGIQIDFGGLDIAPMQLPDVFADRPMVVFGKYKGKAVGKIKIKGYTGLNSIYQDEIDLLQVKPNQQLKALRYLWARNQIKLLDDYDKLSYKQEHKTAITHLGLEYNLLTDYTSFIAVDEANADETSSPTTIGNSNDMGWLSNNGEEYQFNSRGGSVNTHDSFNNLNNLQPNIAYSTSTVQSSTFEKSNANIREKIMKGRYQHQHLSNALSNKEEALVVDVVEQLVANQVSEKSWAEMKATVSKYPLPNTATKAQLALKYGQLLMQIKQLYAMKKSNEAQKIYQYAQQLEQKLGLNGTNYTELLKQENQLTQLLAGMKQQFNQLNPVWHESGQPEFLKLILLGAAVEHYDQVNQIAQDPKKVFEAEAVMKKACKLLEKTSEGELKKDIQVVIDLGIELLEVD